MDTYMKKNIKKQNMTEEETQIFFQLTYVTVLTVLAVLLLGIIIFSGWEMWPVPIIIVCTIACWLLHFMKVWESEKRMYLYTFISLLGVFYYGVHTVAITDVPIIICLFIILLSINKDIKLLYIMASSYVIILLVHIFITGCLNFETEQVVFSRIILGVVCIISAVFISRMIINQQTKINENQARLENELNYTKKENELFLANVSHELRTPINVVNGVSEILLQEELDENLEDKIIAVQMAGKRLYTQVSDILDYSEIMTGKTKVVHSEYEILSVVNDAISNISWDRLEKKLDVAIDVQLEIPKVLVGDSLKLKKIITELIRNAIKFTERGGAYLYISKRDESYGINLNIDMYDTGIGMDDVQKELIYDEAVKADTKATRATAGLGLGLPIIHGMVASMNGYMSVESKKNEGTHMHISIPQEVKDKRRLISVEKSGDFRIAYYFNREKYVDERIGEYYFRMISHIRESVGFEMHQADSLAELKNIVKNSSITHVVIAEWEYYMDREYFDKLSEKKFVIVFVERAFKNENNSNIKLLRKPVYVLSVINMLRNTAPDRDVLYKEEKKYNYKGVKALVVDDDSMNLMVARGVLKTYGITADTCISGQLAIEKCMINDYDIVFMDHMMPQMDGITAMHKIREIRNGHYKDIPFIALTANAVSGAREMFLEEGFNEFVSKPIEMPVMTHSLKKTLKGKEQYYG